MRTLFPYIAAIIDFYVWLIIIYVILSWFRPESGFLGDVYRVLGSVVEPFVGLFRRIVPTVNVGGGGLDLSPLIAILVLQLILRLLQRLQ